MEKVIRNIDDLIEWDEVANLILPEPNQIFSLALKNFKYLGGSFDEQEKIGEEILSQAKAFYEKSLPNCPISFDPDFFWVTIRPVEQYKNKLCFSVVPFFYEFLNHDYGFLLHRDYTFLEHGLLEKNLSREELSEILKTGLRKKRDLLRFYGTQKSLLILTKEKTNSDTLDEDIYKEIRQCNWLIRNIDLVIDFLNTKLPSSIFSLIGKDRVLAYLAFSASHLLNLANPLPEGITYEQVIEPVENYVLLVDYLESIIGKRYKVQFSAYTDLVQDGKVQSHGLMSYSMEDIRQFLKEFYETYPEVEHRSQRPTSYEEILKTRATHTWDRIQKEKLLNQIQVNWELLPQKKILTEGKRASLSTSRNKNSLQDSAQMKHDYDLLEDKLSFFETTEPLCVLSGIHTFLGYQAYVYSNGMVVFEKFYQERKSGLYPAKDSAIYIMKFSEFAELSKYSRTELIQEIRDFNNPDIIRICHNGNWKDRLRSAIGGIGYGDLELGYIEELTRSLSTEVVNKQKRMEM